MSIRKMCMIMFLAALNLVFLFAGAAAEISKEDLLAQWHFDGDAADTSGNANHGVVHGAVFVNGKFDKALSFKGGNDIITGVSDYVSVAINFPQTDYTYMLWFKTSSSTTGISSVKKHDLGDFHDRQLFLNDGNICHRLWIEETICSSKKDYADNNWHYAAVVVQSGIGQKIYVDGVQVASGNKDSSDFIWDKQLDIGNAQEMISGAYNFKGIIDEVSIYNRPFSAREIKELYESETIILTAAKVVSPPSIKQGENVSVTLSVKNTGASEITDIEISDTIPADAVYISGENSKKYSSLKPKESREFQYVIQINHAGIFNLDAASIIYIDEKGEVHETQSSKTAVEVLPGTIPIQTASAVMPDPMSSAVLLHGEKTSVVLGEDILIRLSAVNLITNPTMTVQVILYPPSGMSVTSSEFVMSGAGIYTTTYLLKPGDGKDIQVSIKTNQVGDFSVQGRIIYYFGDNKTSAEDHTLSLPVKVRKLPNAFPDSEKETTPGFGITAGIEGLLFITLIKYAWKRR